MGSIPLTFSPICFPDNDEHDRAEEATSRINDLKDKNARLEIKLTNIETKLEHFEIEASSEMSMLEEKISRLEDKLENKMDLMQLRIESAVERKFVRVQGKQGNHACV